jgi:hypothetical protein
MRKFLAILAFSSVSLAYSDEVKLKPLWEEDTRFAYYRTLEIEGSVCKLEAMIQTAIDSPPASDIILDHMMAEVLNCKNALGLPHNN